MNTQVEQTNEVVASEVVANEVVGRNTPNVLEIGKKAVQDWKNGDGAIARGMQRAIYACSLAWDAIEFHATISNKSGQIEDQWTFSMAEYLKDKPLKEDGTKDNKKSQAQHIAVFSQLFGISEPTTNQKARVKAAITIVSYLYETMGFDQYDLNWIESRSILEVPYKAIEPAPKDDAEEEDKAKYEAMSDKLVALTGKRGRAVADLERASKPKPERHATPQVANKGAEFVASVDFVSVTLAAFMDEKTKSAMPAPNKALQRKLFDLSTLLTTYFDASGREEFEEKKETPKRKNTRASKG